MHDFLRYICLAVLSCGAVVPVAAAQDLGDYTVIPASEIGSRAVVMQNGADPVRRRVDRRIVSPFPVGRRIIVRPAGLPREEVETVAVTAPLPVRAVSAPAVPPQANYVDIGTLDAPAPVPVIPETAPAPAAQFIDIGPYSGEIVPLSSFSPN